MRKLLGIAIMVGASVAATAAMSAAETDALNWAYGVAPPGAPAAPAVRDDGKLLHLPGTDRTFTLNQIRGRVDNDGAVRTAPADWFPGDHPIMPKIVAEGDNARGIVACSLCHYPNGKGRSENASPAGLSKDYIVRQLNDMREDFRQSAERRKANTQQMVGFAKAMTNDEIEAAAAYFSSMAWTPWIRVVETNMVPKTRSQGGMWIPLTGVAAGSEAIGDRIVEVPENSEYTETLRNPHSGFVAYVPVGAVAKGKQLVATGGGKTVQCAICHGENLNGIGSVPGIAARSPSYLARQLNDFKQGARHGDMAELMQRVVAKLTPDDILNIVAYTASLPAPISGTTKAAQR